jgi:hypothetical protein
VIGRREQADKLCAMPQESTTSFNVYGCRLARPDVEALMAAAMEEMGGDVRTRLSSSRDVTKFESDTLGDLLKELGDPQRLPNLKISVASRSGGPGLDPRVTIEISGEMVEVTVSGKSETWVLGRAAQLKRMLRTRHRALAMFHPFPTTAIVGLPIFLAGMFGALIPYGDLTIKGGQVIEIMIGGLLGGLLVGWLVGHALSTVLVMSGPVKLPWSRGDKIAFAGVIAALMAVVAAVVVPLAT